MAQNRGSAGAPEALASAGRASPSEVAESIDGDAASGASDDPMTPNQVALADLEEILAIKQRQAVNGPVMMLLLLSRIIHLLIVIALPVLLYKAWLCLLVGCVHATHVGAARDQPSSCLPPSSWMYSAAQAASYLWCLLPPCPDPMHPWVSQTLTPMRLRLGAAWGALWPALCPWESGLWCAAAALAALSCVALHFWYKGLLFRRLLVFSSAGITITAFKLAKMHGRRLGDADSDDMWEYVNGVMAVYMYRTFLRLKGTWVKTGQYIGSRADIMPQAITDEFAKLQDAVPPSPFASIKETIETSFDKPLSSVFDDFQETALAAASIAQVHMARLKDGTKVVVKVQHHRVLELMMDDLSSLWTIVRFVAWAEPQYDFTTVIEELVKHVKLELDFHFEVENLQRAGKAMAASGLNVIIPKPIPELTRTRVCVMEFCEGMKLTDPKVLAKIPNKEALMRVVCESFAYQMHIDGLFNADPHPGNILVQINSKDGAPPVATPVLLDWGLAKIMDDDKRLAFAQLVWTAHDKDFIGMLDAFVNMGLKLNREDPLTDMSNIRFMFRDTSPPDEARKDFQREIKKMEKNDERLMRETGRKTPVDALPGDLLFFARVTDLMQGMGSRMRVRAPYLGIMAPFAKKALVDRHPPPATLIYPNASLSALEEKVRRLLSDLMHREQIVGCQVCVYKDGTKLVDTAAGWRGNVDQRPVGPDMLFCGLKMTSAVVATAVHLLVDRGLLRYDDPVSACWPAFGKHGKAEITVRQVLAHQSWLQHAIPADISMTTLMNAKTMFKAIEETEPLPGTPGKCVYHPYMVWILAGLVEACVKQPVSQYVQQQIASCLDIENEFHLGLASHIAEESMATLSFELPTEALGGGEGEDGINEMMSMGEKHQNPEDLLEDGSDDGLVLKAIFAKLRGKQYLMDPRIANHERLCQSPSNGYFSARALAKFFDTLKFVLSPGRLEDVAAVQGTDSSLIQNLFGDGKSATWGLGLQVLGFQKEDGAVHNGIGHWAGGGSLAFTFPEESVSFAMTVNKLSRDSLTNTEAVVQLVCDELGLGQFVSE
uniref:Beta-lactamase-related domain-containing protein n=1 Tax=Eutreptiella gymnastica TaxID=73025 RepID=A0A7S4CTW3_9EUGL